MTTEPQPTALDRLDPWPARSTVFDERFPPLSEFAHVYEGF